MLILKHCSFVFTITTILMLVTAAKHIKRQRAKKKLYCLGEYFLGIFTCVTVISFLFKNNGRKSLFFFFVFSILDLAIITETQNRLDKLYEMLDMK